MKIKLGIALLATFSVAASADPRDDALASIVACRSISGVLQRLACFDNATAHVAVPGTTPSRPAQAMSAPAAPAQDFTVQSLPSSNVRAPQTSTDSFGSESVASAGAVAYPLHHAGDTVDSIFAHLASYSFGGDGRATFTLDNGQVWRQATSDQPLRRLANPAASYQVKISREGGASGSYTLRLSGMARTVFVRRIR